MSQFVVCNHREPTNHSNLSAIKIHPRGRHGRLHEGQACTKPRCAVFRRKGVCRIFLPVDNFASGNLFSRQKCSRRIALHRIRWPTNERAPPVCIMHIKKLLAETLWYWCAATKVSRRARCMWAWRVDWRRARCRSGHWRGRWSGCLDGSGRQ